MCFCDRQEKELIKALETPEEKRARRLAKKVLFCKILNEIMQVGLSVPVSLCDHKFGGTRQICVCKH